MAAVGGLTAGTLKGVGNKFAGRGFFDSGVAASNVGAVAPTLENTAMSQPGGGYLQKLPTGESIGFESIKDLQNAGITNIADPMTRTFTPVPGSGVGVPSTTGGAFDYVKTPFTSAKEAFLGAPGTVPTSSNVVSQAGGVSQADPSFISKVGTGFGERFVTCLLYTSPSPRDS